MAYASRIPRTAAAMSGAPKVLLQLRGEVIRYHLHKNTNRQRKSNDECASLI